MNLNVAKIKHVVVTASDPEAKDSGTTVYSPSAGEGVLWADVTIRAVQSDQESYDTRSLFSAYIQRTNSSDKFHITSKRFLIPSDFHSKTYRLDPHDRIIALCTDGDVTVRVEAIEHRRFG